MKKGKRWSAAPSEAHVRLYRHELECPAYRTLSPEARTLLVELRALYSPKNGDNRVFCSVRQMMQRCGLSQTPAQRARDELVEKGWVKIAQMGAFNCKVRHATVFALENEAPNSGNGSRPGKAYMSWQPSSRQRKKDGTGTGYRAVSEASTDSSRDPERITVTVSESSAVKPKANRLPVSQSITQIGLPPEGRSCSEDSEVHPEEMARLLGARKKGAA